MGYRARQGFAVWRVRVRRGGRKRQVAGGICYGKPKTAGVNHLKNERNSRTIGECRIGRHCGGMRVLNSYWVNEDAVYKYFEVILVDPAHKAIRRHPEVQWIVNPVHKHREMRGLTSAGLKARGLRNKGCSGHKMRPSWKAVWKRNNTLRFGRFRKQKHV
eukprot:NODE_1707_length_780_cov_1191.523940_g1228_i1.p2 GENE.NODE_1707_length_780_cov_1191.523940_g1228_i1~~NODE_1707_length_780_cov_1191.523940_g1228_i1.p2  ORF type:complete len:160 (+),score=36.03 NODE_1707_length_780_cov_1191.523940_g1228_i1:181-660(+)